jgi:hypothetical protein
VGGRSKPGHDTGWLATTPGCSVPPTLAWPGQASLSPRGLLATIPGVLRTINFGVARASLVITAGWLATTPRVLRTIKPGVARASLVITAGVAGHDTGVARASLHQFQGWLAGSALGFSLTLPAETLHCLVCPRDSPVLEVLSRASAY